MDEDKLSIIREYPIGGGLEVFRNAFASACLEKGISNDSDAVDKLDQGALQDLTFDLLHALQGLPASRRLPSRSNETLYAGISRLSVAVGSGQFDLTHVKPLFTTIVQRKPDAEIWRKVYEAVTERTPTPRTIVTSVKDTPLRFASGSVNSKERREDVDVVLKEELGVMYVGLPDFHNTFFGDVTDLETMSSDFFKECQEGSNPLFRHDSGWRAWPNGAKEKDVLSWLENFNEKITVFAQTHQRASVRRLNLWTKPDDPIEGSVAIRKMDVGFFDAALAEPKDKKTHWRQMIVAGELKNNPSADSSSDAGLDLGKYAREVFATQDTRRYVLGFTLCGSLMRVWAFDRLGGIASKPFDINQDGQQFVFTMLGFHCMNEDQLGFDPTIQIGSDGKRFIEIRRDGSQAPERIILDKVILRTRSVRSRGTTCWKGHPEGKPEMPLVIKDSWQYPESDVEGEMLLEVTAKEVRYVARGYHHETVQVAGRDDDVRFNVRGGLDITKATNYHEERQISQRSTQSHTISRQGRSNTPSTTNRKRPSREIDSANLPPPAKRGCSSSPTKDARAVVTRVHRRVILQDYGMPIYKASSPAALLAAFEHCIEGHESLHKAGILHRDISINNLMINEDENNASWPGFLIDLDLAIRESREGPTGAEGKTGTRAFMAIGALLGEQHSFMHDLESFFWVLFWVCIHYNGPDEDIGATKFESWNYETDEKLFMFKKGIISDEDDFLSMAKSNFTDYYQELVSVVNKLRRRIFPNGQRWKRLEPELYSSMREILNEAQKNMVLSSR